MLRLRFISPLLLSATMLLVSCTIEPELHLPDGNDADIEARLPIVITDLKVLWGVEADWRSKWYYGWDAKDEQMWGKIEYPMPTNYEVRRTFLGEHEKGKALERDGFTVFGNVFRRRYNFGYYNLLLWSNIDSDDGTQTVIINESEPDNIWATTSQTRVNYRTADNEMQRTRVPNTHNQPEIFYSAKVGNFYISKDPADYDYFDNEEKVWVKILHTELTPVVYIYLVQVVLHNNKNRVRGLTDRVTVSGLADGVSLHTGYTSQVDANITFDMRLKNDIDCEGEQCDVMGGKLTTFGLCGMKPWIRSRAGKQEVTRLDLENKIALSMFYYNNTESTATFDITDQVREHPHGGVITIHINVDDIEIPPTPGGTSSGFIPTVSDYEHKEYEFNIR